MGLVIFTPNAIPADFLLLRRKRACSFSEVLDIQNSQSEGYIRCPWGVAGASDRRWRGTSFRHGKAHRQYFYFLHLCQSLFPTSPYDLITDEFIRIVRSFWLHSNEFKLFSSF